MVRKAIIFDLYGTLIYGGLGASAEKLSKVLDVPIEKWNTQKKSLLLIKETGNLEDSVKVVCNYLKIKDKKKINALLQYITKDIDGARPYIGTLLALEILKDRYKLAVLSNISTPYKTPFDRLDLRKYFSTIFFSCERGILKPQKEAFLTVIKELGVLPEEALMVGDDYNNDYQGALGAGLDARWIDRGEHKYGKLTFLKDVKKINSFRELLI